MRFRSDTSTFESWSTWYNNFDLWRNLDNVGLFFLEDLILVYQLPILHITDRKAKVYTI